jgi:hypothetical protein
MISVRNHLSLYNQGAKSKLTSNCWNCRTARKPVLNLSIVYLSMRNVDKTEEELDLGQGRKSCCQWHLRVETSPICPMRQSNRVERKTFIINAGSNHHLCSTPHRKAPHIVGNDQCSYSTTISKMQDPLFIEPYTLQM